MSASEVRPGQESSTTPSGRREHLTEMDATQKEFCRKLLSVLSDILHEEDRSETNAGVLLNEASRPGAVLLEGVEGKEPRASVPLQTPLRGSEGSQANGSLIEAQNCIRLKELCGNYEQLTPRLLSSLKSLGGGRRTANALEDMREAIRGIGGLITLADNPGEVILTLPHSFAIDLEDCRNAVADAYGAFIELGVVNKRLIDTLDHIPRHLEVILAKVDAEYGLYEKVRVNVYLDSIFKPLISDFGVFVAELTTFAEKELPALRLTQEFRSQRFLNLTTIATFLSSVTATTLQLTTEDPGDRTPLTATTNLMWLISLVFSTASAVYSLLTMSWYQSSVTGPNSVLPPFLKACFRKGPIYTLIVALLTFSIGLCLLAFRVADNEGILGSAAVPTAFAGIHANIILLLAILFLRTRTQWNAKYIKGWHNKRRNGHLARGIDLTQSYGRRMKRSLSIELAVRSRVIQAKRQLKEVWTSLKVGWPKSKKSVIVLSPAVVQDKPNDIEQGQSAPPRHVDPSKETQNSSTTPDISVGVDIASPGGSLVSPPAEGTTEEQNQGQNQELSAPSTLNLLNDQNSNPKAAVNEHAATFHGVTSVVADQGSEVEILTKDVQRPFKSLLQFSPDGRLLACAHKDVVTIYHSVKSFTVFNTFKTPDSGQVEQISWNPIAFVERSYQKNRPPAELLVRSSGSISIWSLRTKDSEAHMMGHLNQASVSVQWTSRKHAPVEEDLGKYGTFDQGYLVCTAGTTIRVFNETCEELRLIDVRELIQRNVKSVVLATFILKKYLVCIVSLTDDPREWQFVVNLEDGTIHKEELVFPAHKSMSISLSAGRILLHGSQSGVELEALSVTASRGSVAKSGGKQLDIAFEGYKSLLSLTYVDQELKEPEQAVSFHGLRDNMLVGYSAGDVVALYYRYRQQFLSGAHIFRSPDTEAIPKNPVSFAVNPGMHSEPFMFAFSDKHGSITIWSLQSNKQLLDHPSARTFEVHDHRDIRRDHPDVITGRLLVLPPPS